MRRISIGRIKTPYGVSALDVLINNAGINFDSSETGGRGSHESIHALTPRDMLTMFSVNTIASMMITKAFLALLEAGEHPRIINVSSKMGSIAEKRDAETEYTYSASKAVLNMLTRVLLSELRSRGITVIAMNPGWVATDMGGTQAPLQPHDSASGILRQLDRLRMDDSGRFVDWSGNEVPW